MIKFILQMKISVIFQHFILELLVPYKLDSFYMLDFIVVLRFFKMLRTDAYCDFDF